MDPIRVFVGTDQWQHQSGAERVLEHSIRANTEADVEVTYMRSGDPGWEISETGAGDTWAVGAATAGGWVKAPGRNWGTPFSCFRFAVPELCGFEGYAIYLDADMLVLGDIADLAALRPRDAGYRSVSAARTDVSVIDCAWFKDRKHWPEIDEMKATRARVFEYTQLLRMLGGVDPTLPLEWNDCDGALYAQKPNAVRLVHYTTVTDGQPWRPYPNVKYPTEWPYCANRKAGELWFEWQEKAANGGANVEK